LRPPAETLRLPLPLRAQIQHYAWGHHSFIQDLFGLKGTDRPCAEAWIGAHPGLPSLVTLDGQELGLDKVIAKHGQAILGAEIRDRFQGLPYLVKILAAARPLSVQVHPTRAQAAAGLRREDAQGLALDAPERNFRDANHKPEMIVAIEPFHALCGFRPLAEIAAALDAAPELARLLPAWHASIDGLRTLVTAYLEMPDDRLLPALAKWLARLRAEAPDAGSAEHWVLEADRMFSTGGRPDRGLFWVMLLNHIKLDRWQGLYLPAGVPHAYLRGAGVEVMASSDNVLRAGLTPKHVDARGVATLLRFEAGRTPIVSTLAAPDGEVTYVTPAEEFEVRRLDLSQASSGCERVAAGPEILLFLEQARARLQSSGVAIEFGSGGACLIPSGESYRVTGTGTLIRVRVPDARPAKVFRGKEPKSLAFGTSGLRGLVTDITDLEAYVNTRGFLDYLLTIGDNEPGTPVAVAGDLRPSTDSPARSILRAVARAVTDAGFGIVNCGKVPTPALTYYALVRGWPSVMVTGSHIPFDRNGIKFNRREGEILKTEETPILRAVDAVRSTEYSRPEEISLFGHDGMFHPHAVPSLPPLRAEAYDLYVRRYLDFFPAKALAGLRVAVFEHTAVGRELLVEVLTKLGATVYPIGRSDTFVPIDTEAISDDRMADLQRLLDMTRERHGPIDAMVSTDGDGDRPLLIAVDANHRARFVGGDLVGLVVADYLAADAIAVPVTANDAIDLHLAARGVARARTRVGSPWVVAALLSMQGARRVGWEANGGFLTASEIVRDGRRLAPLPTRDAMLPLLAVLHAANERGVPVAQLFSELPSRHAKSDLVDGVPDDARQRLEQRYSPVQAGVVAAAFREGDAYWSDAAGQEQKAVGALAAGLGRIRAKLSQHFSPERGFGALARIDWLDGIRMHFDNGDVAHVRASGNAPQLRIYAVASTEERAQAIVAMGVREPDGLLRRLLAPDG
jgi:phosphomannomutase